MNILNEILFYKLIKEETYEEYNLKLNFSNTLSNDYKNYFFNNYDCLLMDNNDLDACSAALYDIVDKSYTLIFDEKNNQIKDLKGNLLCFTQHNCLVDKDSFSFMCFIHSQFRSAILDNIKKQFH